MGDQCRRFSESATKIYSQGREGHQSTVDCQSVWVSSLPKRLSVWSVSCLFYVAHVVLASIDWTVHS